MPYGGNWSFGQTWRRDHYNFTGSTQANSKLTLTDTGISSNYRSITPKNRSGANGIGSYNHDTMMNFNSFYESNGRVSSIQNFYTNSGISSGVSTKQITALTETKPNIFWNMHSYDYSTNKNENFTSQNGNWYYNFWRIGQSGSNIVNDVAQNTKGMFVVLNDHVSHDDQLFTIAGVEQPDESHGNKFNKITQPTRHQDFNVTRPLVFHHIGGLPRAGDNVYSKQAPGDGEYQAGDLDYYLNYYPKYEDTLTNIPRSKSGYDWSGIAGGTGNTIYRGYSTGFNKHYIR